MPTDDTLLEADWKKFRALVPQLRERYLAEKNRQLSNLLASPGKTETERFWDTLERMNEEATILQDCLDRQSRSNMFLHMALMVRHGLLKPADMALFSPELQKRLEEVRD